MNFLKAQLEANAKLALDCFAEDHMKASPSNSQTINLKRRRNEAKLWIEYIKRYNKTSIVCQIVRCYPR